MAEDLFTLDYNSLKTAMKELGLLPNKGNFSKFSTTVCNVNVNVAAHIATQKPLFRIGSDSNTYSDDICQYQVWAERNGNTFISISGGCKGRLPVDDISNAVSDTINKIKNS